MNISSSLANNKHWLLFISDFQFVGLIKVFCNTHLFSIFQIKESSTWSFIKIYIFYNVCPFVSIVSNNALVDKLSFALVLKDFKPFLILRIISFNFIICFLNASKNCLGWHKPRTIIYNQSTSCSVFVSRSFKAWPNLHAKWINIDSSFVIKEFWSISKLYHACFIHSLLNYDI